MRKDIRLVEATKLINKVAGIQAYSGFIDLDSDDAIGVFKAPDRGNSLSDVGCEVTEVKSVGLIITIRHKDDTDGCETIAQNICDAIESVDNIDYNGRHYSFFQFVDKTKYKMLGMDEKGICEASIRCNLYYNTKYYNTNKEEDVDEKH